MRVEAVSATYKGSAGGQLLGPHFRGTTRTACSIRDLASDLAPETPDRREAPEEGDAPGSDILAAEGLIEEDEALASGHRTGDITREPLGISPEA